MYGIDINFLNDRSDRPVDAIAVVDKPKAAPGRKLPIIVGLACGLVALGGVGGSWLVFNKQQDTLTAQSQALDSQLAELQQKISQIDTVRQQTQAINAEIQALAGVFERIRPWSAIVRDMQARIPSRTQLARVVQTGVVEGGSAAGGIELGGNACSFDDVNDFMLTLKQSPFLDSESLQITNASLGSDVPGRCPGASASEESATLVTYTITADIKSLSAATLLDELNRQQESTGLAARIRALQTTGAIE